MSAGSEGGTAVRFLTAPALLKDAFLRRATGELVFSRGDTVKRVFCRNGFVLFAASSAPEDRLGDVLLSRGLITVAQHEESGRQVAATGAKQGMVLVQMGAISAKDLFRGLVLQVREIVLSLFCWEDGRCRFVEGPPTQEEIVSLRLHPAGLIFEGLARLAGEPSFNAAWRPEGMPLRVNPSPPLILEELECPPAASRLVALISRGESWERIPEALALSREAAAALLYGLALLGFVGTARREARAAPPPAAAAPESAPEPAPEPDAARLRARIEELAAKLPALNFYQLLNVGPGADRSAIKSSYLALAREFHPDRFFRGALQDLHPRVNAIFTRINEAYHTLQSPARRTEYDREAFKPVSARPEEGGREHDSRVAQEQFRKGLSLLNSGDVWSAIEALRWAVNLSPENPRYHAQLGLALTRSRRRLHEAEEHCRTAISLDSGNAHYRVLLGMVYKAGRASDRARREFEAALRLDPRNPQAAKELRELEEDGRELGGTGLLGRLFK